MFITLYKMSGGFAGGSQYTLEILFPNVSSHGKDDAALLEEAKANTKEILKKLGVDIDVDEIRIIEKFSL